MKSYNFFLILFSYLTTFTLIAIFINNIIQLKRFNYSNKRKLNNENVPLVGGICIFISFLIFSFYLYYNNSFFLININQFFIIIFSTIVIFSIGLFDDWFGLSVLQKVVFQIIAALIFIFGFNLGDVIIISFINNYYINIFLIIIFILGVTNSINLIDGVDNLAGGLSLIIISSFIILNNFLVSPQINYLLITIIGSLLAYLSFNIFVKRIFLGDSGSLFLGWMFSILSLLLLKYNINKLSIFIPLIILGIPSFDVLYIMLYRFYISKNKTIMVRFKNIFNSDHNHIHHILLQFGYSNLIVCLILFIFSITFTVIAIYVFKYFNIDNSHFILFSMFLLFIFSRIKLNSM